MFETFLQQHTKKDPCPWKEKSLLTKKSSSAIIKWPPVLKLKGKMIRVHALIKFWLWWFKRYVVNVVWVLSRHKYSLENTDLLLSILYENASKIQNIPRFTRRFGMHYKTIHLLSTIIQRLFDFYIDTYAITRTRECNVGDICLNLKIYLIVASIKF